MRKSTKIRESKQDIIILSIIYFLLGLILFFVLYPLVFVTSASFSDAGEVVAGRVWLWPVKPSLLAYNTIFLYRSVVSGFLNSFWYVVVGTSISITVTLCAAYPLSRHNFYGKAFLLRVFTITILFNGGLIPFYLVVNSLQLTNTRWSIVLPTALSVWNMIIMRTYLQTNIPQELYEASEIDGCSDTKAFFWIVLPLSKPIIAVIALYYAVALWNNYFNAMIFLRNNELFPLQLWLREILIANQFDILNMTGLDTTEILRRQGLKDLLKYALIVVSTVPLMIVYPFIPDFR
jgi:putative aldouronate transport system permease protein